LIQNILTYLFLIAFISPILFFIWTQVATGIAGAYVFTGRAVQPAPRNQRVIMMRVHDYDMDEDY